MNNKYVLSRHFDLYTIRKVKIKKGFSVGFTVCAVTGNDWRCH